jgi:hypothetical protein
MLQLGGVVKKFVEITCRAGALLGCVIIAGPALADGPCNADRISNTNGAAIRLQSGQLYQAFPGSSPKLANWLPLDKVTVCQLSGAAVQITNIDERNQVIKAMRVN